MASPAAVLNILLTANTAQANSALAGTQAQLQKTAAVAQSTTARTATSVARGGARLAAGVGVIGGASIVAAAKFEQSFADVRKTVDATEPQFKRIETGLRDMAKTIPVSVTELSELAGEAGALGVKSRDIVKFTRVAADLGVATDLSASAAANALARVANIMDTKGEKAFSRMGATLVDLGNKGASTETEITEMALRIAGAGQTIGLSEANVLGFAAALANVGIRAEAGGSAISRVMLEMQDAVARGGADLEAFAKIAGTSGEDFAKQFSTDAPAAIQTFVEGLDKVKDSGGSVVETLEAVGLNEIRVRDTLLRLGGATGEVTKAQEIANKAWGENSALAEEANKRYKTTTSQFEILKNRVFDLGITFGQDLLPEVNKAMKALGEGNLGGAISAMAELGGRMAVKLAGALGKAFLESDILGKLFIAGALIRLIGGKGAFLAAGKMGGKFFGRGFVLGAVLALPLLLPEAFKLGQTLGRELKRGIKDIGIDDFVKEFFGLTDRLSQQEVIETVKAGTLGVDQAINALEKVGVSTKKARKIINETYGFTEKDTDRFADKVGDLWTSLSAKITDNSGKARRQGLEDFRRLGQGTDKASKDMAGKVSGNVDRMVGAVGSGYNRLKDNTNKALKAFNAKPVNFAIVGGKKVGTSGLQRGGPINQGAPAGDSVPAMLEKGEYVLNRNAVAGIGKDRLDAINFGPMSRFQTGGLAGLQPGIANLAKWSADRYGLRVSSGLRPGTGSYHNIGAAVDLVPPSMTATKGIFAAFKNQLAELFYDPWGGFDNGQMIGAIGGHLDHIHAAILGGGGPAAQAARLAKLVLKGPAGPLRDMGQAGLDKVRSAAQKYLSRQTMTQHGNIGTPSGTLSGPQLQSLWSRSNPDLRSVSHLMAMIALGESGGDPKAVGHDPGGTRGLGLWQITTGFNSDLIKKYGGESKMFVPGINALAAGDIYRRQGRGAWYAPPIPFQRGGALPTLDTGGRVTKGGVAEVHPGDVHRGTGIEIHLHGPGMDALIDEMYAVVDGERVEIAEYTLREGGRNIARSKQLAGRAGRAE